MSNKMRIIPKIIIIIILGTILHYIYKWSGLNPILGIIGAVNESVWEHLKLLFWPSVILGVIEYFFIDYKYNFIVGKTISIIAGMALIVILFYTYTGILGQNFVIIDIIIYIISVAVSQLISYKITTSDLQVKSYVNALSLLIIGLLIILFILFTFDPPKIPLFYDSHTDSYGI